MSTAAAARTARNTDPASSHLAAARVTRSGQRASQIDLVVRAVKKHPGLTSHELTDKINAELARKGARIDRYVPGRRLSEAADRSLPEIERGPQRKCRVNGHKALTWWPFGEAPAEEPEAA